MKEEENEPYETSIEEDKTFGEKVLKKVTGQNPKDVMYRLMNNQLYCVFDLDKNGEVITDESGKPVISVRKTEIKAMYDIQTQPKFRDGKSRRAYCRQNIRQVRKRYQKEGKSEAEIDKEVNRIKHLYKFGFYPEFKKQNVKELYEKEVKVKEPGNDKRTKE